MKPIGDVLGKFNIPDDPFSFSPMGRHIAKLNFEYIDKLKEKKSNLILVTAITPTPAGEGKTTTSVGLNDGLNKITRWWCVTSVVLGFCAHSIPCNQELFLRFRSAIKGANLPNK